jgi:ribosome-binding factor A
MARRTGQTPAGASQRQLRVAEEIRRVMSDIFARAHWREPALIGKAITVSGARISPDLKNATIYCTPLGGGDTQEVIAALNRSKGYLRGELGHAMKLRFVPDIRFEADRSFDEAQHIEEILRSERVARDLARDEDSSEDG